MAYVIPALITVLFIFAARKGINTYESFISGAEKGLSTVFSIFPALVAILSVSAMLRESGAVDFIAKVFAPVCNIFSIPSEILPLAIVRPLSGGGSVGLLTDLVGTYGPQNRISRMACILCASTETTFYTIMVYFRKTKVNYTKRVLLAAIFGDLVGILCASVLA